jgi:hypothetical protein
MRTGPALALVLPLAAMACGPIPVDRAEAACFEALGPETGLRGQAAMGVSNDGLVTDLDLAFTFASYQGRDPAEVYDACVYRKSGQLPRRPLYDRPDWKG